MPGIAGSHSKQETTVERHVSSEVQNVSVALGKSSSQLVALPLFNPSSNRVFNEMEHDAPLNDGRIENVQNCDNESRDIFAPTVHSEVVKNKFAA